MPTEPARAIAAPCPICPICPTCQTCIRQCGPARRGAASRSPRAGRRLQGVPTL